MVKSREEIIKALNNIFGENATSDECISVIEDVTDTMDDFTSRLSDDTDWHQRYVDNDKEWREKYVRRFSEGSSKPESAPPAEPELEEPEAPTKFDELFKTEGR